MVIRLLLFFALQTPIAAATLTHAWGAMTRDNSYYFDQIKKKLREINVQSDEEAANLSEKLGQKYTLEDAEGPLFAFLIPEILAHESYEAFKANFSYGAALQQDEDESLPVILRKFNRWKKKRDAKEDIDRMLSYDFRKLCSDLQTYAEEHPLEMPHTTSDLSPTPSPLSHYLQKTLSLPWSVTTACLLLIAHRVDRGRKKAPAKPTKDS